MIIFLTDVKVGAMVNGQLNLFYEDNLYYEMKGNNFYMSYPFPFYNISDSVAYCIEPGFDITTLNYIGEYDLVYAPYSEEVNKKLELIGHYGYEYPGHNTIMYRVATQLLMWETVSDKTTEIRSEQYGYGDYIDVSYEKQEIMNLVNNHFTKPSFDSKEYNITYDKEFILEDSNKVLENYYVKSSDSLVTRIVDNKLYVTSKTPGKSKISLVKKKYDNNTTIVFVGDDGVSQKIAKFRVSDNVNSEVSFNTSGAKIKIVKVDEETGNTISESGVKFKVKNVDTGNYVCLNTYGSDQCVYETNEDGEVIIPEYLSGNYLVEEVEDQILNGYFWNKEKISVSINHDSQVIQDNDDGPLVIVKFSNKRVKGRVNITKYGEKIVLEDGTYRYDQILLDNVQFQLYAGDNIYVNGYKKYSKDDLITTVVTENGMVVIDDLELGKYYLKEISTDDNHVLDTKKYSFELKYKDQYTSLITKDIEIKNYMKKGTLKFVKLDGVTKEPIPNTLIEIYSEVLYDDRVVPTLIYSGYTNDLGEIILSSLFVGKGYIYEKESAAGYQNNYEEISFEIKENNEIVKISMDNEQIVSIPDTYLDSNKIYHLTSISFMLFGICGLVYAKKK